MKQLLDIPIISYQLFPGDVECISMQDNWLFYYTTAESFFKIIKSMKLKSSRLEKLNDLNEIHYSAYSMLTNPLEMIDLKEFVERKCSVTCFSHHSLYLHKNICYTLVPGCCNPCMWAHYAGKISGVCLVLDRKLLLEENKKIFGENVDLKEVNYDTNWGDNKPTNETADEFLRRNKTNLLFLKAPCWEYESEVRMLLTNINPLEDEPMISIAKSLKAIVVSRKFWENNKTKFIEEAIDPNSFLYEMQPAYWFMLIQDQVAYDIASLDFEEELNAIKTKADNAEADIQKLRV